MIPDRLRVKVQRLGEIADRNKGTDVGDLALELASYIAEQEHTEPGTTAGNLFDPETAIEARFHLHELAISELSRRIGPEDLGPEPEKTVFGFPVILAGGVTPAQIRETIDGFPPGLTRVEALERLEELNLLRRVEVKAT